MAAKKSMFYRRKVLLALIEAFGGSLRRTDCQKFLFLACQAMDKSHYDFFPHKYGGFSSLAYYDKVRLTELGYLRDVEDYELSLESSFLSQLKPKDQKVIRNLAKEWKGVRGRDLIRYVYLKHPEYTVRSNILHRVLERHEIARIRVWWNTSVEPRLFTLGYEGLTVDAYLNKLIQNNIKILIDVRRNPQSMKYGFSKKRLHSYMKMGGIQYVHLPSLGIPSHMRKNLDAFSDYQALFQVYESDMLPKQQAALEQLAQIIQTEQRVALTCFEADHLFCHRHKITDYLSRHMGCDVPVKHL